MVFISSVADLPIYPVPPDDLPRLERLYRSGGAAYTRPGGDTLGTTSEIILLEDGLWCLPDTLSFAGIVAQKTAISASGYWFYTSPDGSDVIGLYDEPDTPDNPRRRFIMQLYPLNVDAFDGEQADLDAALRRRDRREIEEGPAGGKVRAEHYRWARLQPWAKARSFSV